MRILVVESEPGIAHEDAARLQEAGHEVVRCHEPGAPSFPCAGVPHHADCPLEQQAVDVALVVRDEIDERPTHRESGVACAIQARVPLLQRADETITAPFGAHVQRFDGDLLSAIEAAQAAGASGHAHAVRDHLLATAAAEGVDADAVTVVAQRHGRALHVDVHLPAEAASLVTAAKGWAAAAARRYDPSLQVIDVAVTTA